MGVTKAASGERETITRNGKIKKWEQHITWTLLCFHLLSNFTFPVLVACSLFPVLVTSCISRGTYANQKQREIFRRFWLSQIPWMILYNQLALTKFRRWGRQYPIDAHRFCHQYPISTSFPGSRGDTLAVMAGVQFIMTMAIRRPNSRITDKNWTEKCTSIQKIISRLISTAFWRVSPWEK